MSQPKRKPTYTIHNGFRMPMGFPPDCFESGLGYPAQAEDTFIVTYPKCGTTWVQHIVWMIANNGQPLDTSKNINREVPHLEEVGREYVLALPSPRFIKTHLPYALTPHHPDTQYIYIARNPFDCLVSFYYHTQGFEKHYDFIDGTFDDFFECFIAGEVDWGDYFDHLIPWYDQKDQENVIFLTYEDMIKEPRKAIIKIADFLGYRYPDNFKDKTLQKIVEHTSFAKMSQHQSRWSSHRPHHVSPFIRKGKVGDWKTHFSPAQVTRLAKKFRQRAAGTDIQSLWPSLLFVE